MNDHHLIVSGVDAAGKPVETIVPGVRPEPPKASKSESKHQKADEK